MAPKKSIFRQPGARHFQLVHRSQRDPLIHDPDASQHVLKPFERGSTRKGKTRVELESILSSDDVEHDRQAHVGEAALYGIYYDDTQYDYMQHLRAAGVQENGIESILIEAPRSENKDKESSYLQLPADIFASKTELPRNYESQQAVPDSIAGLQPDMDPHLRQVLEALDDDAFVDDEIDDEYFTKLVKDGERGPDRDPKSEFDEDGLDEEDDDNCDVGPGEDAPWEERFAYFKKTREVNMGGQSDDEFVSERDDTVESLPTLSVIGRKGRRRKGSSEASGYSMSSWSMYRNEALQTLDERFDKLLLKEYNEGETTMSDKDEDTDEAPELITSRDDFEAMMSEFMNEYEILGRKMQPKLPGDTGTERFGTLRRSMGQDNRITVHEDSEDEKILVSMENKKDRWDCETIISTYSNLENHPRIIRAMEGNPVVHIRLNPRTGFPRLEECDAISEESDERGDKKVHHTIARPRNESKEDRKLRKTAVKAEKQTRREAKKTLKDQFVAETQAQKKTIETRTKGRIRRL